MEEEAKRVGEGKSKQVHDHRRVGKAPVVIMKSDVWVQVGRVGHAETNRYLFGRHIGWTAVHSTPRQVTSSRYLSHWSSEGAQLWRKNLQRAQKLIDGTFPRELPRRRVSADIDALCDDSVGALTMMQVRIPSGGVGNCGCGASFPLSPADVCPGIFRPADINPYARLPASASRF